MDRRKTRNMESRTLTLSPPPNRCVPHRNISTGEGGGLIQDGHLAALGQLLEGEERVSSFKYLCVNISEDLTWTAHIQAQVKKAKERLYNLRQLRKFRVSPAILKTFYSGAIESVLTQCISVWYGNDSSGLQSSAESCALG